MIDIHMIGYDVIHCYRTLLLPKLDDIYAYIVNHVTPSSSPTSGIVDETKMDVVGENHSEPL